MRITRILLLLFCFRAVIVLAQPNLQAYMQMIIEFTETKQHPEAIKLCDKLIESYPDNADIYFLRGINKYLAKEYEEAETDFNKTLELNPNYPDAHLYRAKTRKAQKNFFGALRDYGKATDKNFTQTLSSLAGDMIKSVFTDNSD